MERKYNMMRKYIGLVLAGGLLICVLCSCTSSNEIVDFDNINLNTKESTDQSRNPTDAGNDQTQNPANGNIDQTDTLPHAGEIASTVSLEEHYRSILLGNADFISTDLQNQELNLTEIKKIITDDEITVNITQFAIIDLDRDGENEIVLWIQINGISDYGFEILQYQNGDVYGYTLPYREFMNLKTDGTFLFSGGVADFGIGKVIFSENGYMINQQSYSESQYDSNNELKTQYYVNGESCSEEVFNEAMRHQEEKTNVEWNDLSVDGITSAFEKMQY